MGMVMYAKGCDPLLGGFTEVPLNDLGALEAAFNKNTLGVMLETIQGSGGLHVASEAFMKKVQAHCRKHHALFIVDEVQTGMGRTGNMLGFEHYNVVPDIITVAKTMDGVEMSFPGRQVVEEMLKGGILSNCTHGNIIRLVPPLVTMRQELDTFTEVLIESIKSAQ